MLSRSTRRLRRAGAPVNYLAHDPSLSIEPNLSLVAPGLIWIFDMAEREQLKQPTHDAYSVIRHEGQDDSWLNVGLVFPHMDGDGFNAILQAFPLDGKITFRETADDDRVDSPAKSRRRRNRADGEIAPTATGRRSRLARIASPLIAAPQKLDARCVLRVARNGRYFDPFLSNIRGPRSQSEKSIPRSAD